MQRPEPTTPLKFKLATVACAATASWGCVRVGVGIAHQPGGRAVLLALLLSAIAAVLGLLVCDASSGVLHWVMDNYPTENTPLIGKAASGFQCHHTRPEGLYDSTFWTVAIEPAQFFWPPVALLAACQAHYAVMAYATSYLITGWLGLGAHRWMHGGGELPVPRIASVLRRLRLIQVTEDHLAHHRLPWSTNFCIVNGANNRWMSAIDLFPRLENLIFRLTGVRPHVWSDPEVEAYSRTKFRSRAERDAARAAMAARALRPAAARAVS